MHQSQTGKLCDAVYYGENRRRQATVSDETSTIKTAGSAPTTLGRYTGIKSFSTRPFCLSVFSFQLASPSFMSQLHDQYLSKH